VISAEVMLPKLPTDPGKEDWQGAALWKAGNNTQNILIPLEVDKSKFITGFVVLDDNGFPEEGQRTLYDYAGSSFRESCASLTIHRQLDDPTLEDGYTITLLKLAYSIDHSNVFSRNHAIKTAFWARNIARKLGFAEEQLDQIELDKTFAIVRSGMDDYATASDFWGDDHEAVHSASRAYSNSGSSPRKI
jgi:hypothetical protein